MSRSDINDALDSLNFQVLALKKLVCYLCALNDVPFTIKDVSNKAVKVVFNDNTFLIIPASMIGLLSKSPSLVDELLKDDDKGILK